MSGALLPVPLAVPKGGWSGLGRTDAAAKPHPPPPPLSSMAGNRLNTVISQVKSADVLADLKSRMTAERVAALRSSAAALTRVDEKKSEEKDLAATLAAAEDAMTQRLRAKAEAEGNAAAQSSASASEYNDPDEVARLIAHRLLNEVDEGTYARGSVADLLKLPTAKRGATQAQLGKAAVTKAMKEAGCDGKGNGKGKNAAAGGGGGQGVPSGGAIPGGSPLAVVAVAGYMPGGPGSSSGGGGGGGGGEKPNDEEEEMAVDYDSAAEKDSTKPELACMACKVELIPSKMLLLAEPDWAGKLWGQCVGCSPMGEGVVLDITQELYDAQLAEAAMRKFKRAQNRSWQRFGNSRKDRVERMRGVDFTNMMAYFVKKYGGVPKSDLRLLALARMKFVVVAFAASLALEDARLQVKMLDNCNIYLKQIEEMASRPWCADKVITRELTAEAAGYLTKMTDHTSVSWLCRYPDCGFFGMNHSWVKHVAREKFRCPLCGREYAPWSQAKGQVMAQKVVTITCPITGDVMHLPLIWPSGAEDGWLLRAVEDKAEEIAPLSVYSEALASENHAAIEELAHKIGIPTAFALLPWNVWAENCFDSAHYPPSQWLHLKQAGVWGAKMDLSPGKFVIFDDLPLLIKLLSQSVASGMQLSRM